MLKLQHRKRLNQQTDEVQLPTERKENSRELDFTSSTHLSCLSVKMQRRRSFNFKRVLPLFLLMFAAGWRRCAAQVSREEANEPPDGPGGDAGAFFALRSCHQLLHSDGGEFFSPDYLCSNPSLWCNWTIRVDPGKRIHLHLEDLTPDDACHLKQDEIHVDDPADHSGGHKVLQKCWKEAKYTSSSNALEVVLLIGGWPHLPYRGFYGRYQAFGPPVIYNPHDGFKSGAELVESDSLQHLAPADSNEMFDDHDPRSAVTAELEEEEEEEFENLHPVSGNYSHIYPVSAVPTVPTSTQGTSRSGRGVQPEPPQQLQQQHQELKPDDRSPAAVRRNVEEERENRSKEEEPDSEPEQTTVGVNRTEVDEASDQRPSTSEAPEPEETEQIHPHPNVVQPLSDHRGNPSGRNQSETPHLPGDHLFEAAVEVNFSQDLDEHWDELARSLLLSVKASISERLEALHTPLTMSSKRIKRLNAGVLYILWLHIRPAPGGRQVHRAVHSAIQGLIATSVGLGGIHRKAVIVSVSTADVNECGTQLVLCDINADCVNQFGSYSCRCRPGFLDRSRLGSGGTVCVDMKAAGCSSGLSAETKGVYVLFFLLSSLILLLLLAAGVLYRRHHRGTFLVRCHSSSSSSSISPPDPNNNHHNNSHLNPDDSDLPPPPPPARGPRDGWPQVKERCPAVDLPLLRFSSLLPADGYMEPRDGGKM